MSTSKTKQLLAVLALVIALFALSLFNKTFVKYSDLILAYAAIAAGAFALCAWLVRKLPAKILRTCLIAGAVSGIALCVADAAIFRKASFDTTWFALLAATAIVVAALLLRKTSRLFSTIALGFSPTLCLLALALAVFCAVNLNAPALPEKAPVATITPQQEADFEAFVKLVEENPLSKKTYGKTIDNFRAAYRPIYDLRVEKDTQAQIPWDEINPMLDAALPYLNEFWEFLATHEPRTNIFTFFLDGNGDVEFPISYLNVHTAIGAEILNIQRLSETAVPEETAARLQKFLHGLTDLLTSTGDHLVIYVPATRQAVFGAHSALKLAPALSPAKNAEIAAQLQTLAQAIHGNMARSIQAEFWYLEYTIDHLEALEQRSYSPTFAKKMDSADHFTEHFKIPVQHTASLAVNRRVYQWPFFDKQRTRTELWEMRETVLAAQKLTSFAAQLPALNEVQKQFENLYKEPQGLKKVINPKGRQVLLYSPYISYDLIFQVEACESIVTASSHLLSLHAASEKTSAIINRLTGKPFELASGNSIDIRAGLPERTTHLFESYVSEKNSILAVAR